MWGVGVGMIVFVSTLDSAESIHNDYRELAKPNRHRRRENKAISYKRSQFLTEIEW